MSTVLDRIKNFKANRWYTKSVPQLANLLWLALAFGDSVKSGGVLSAGASITASVHQIDMTGALAAKLDGELKADLAGFTNFDVFAVANDAIFQDGTTADGISLAGDETAYLTVITTNSDGSDDVTGDNGVQKLLTIVAGTPTTYMNQSAFLTPAQIDQALAASAGVHAATSGWAKLATFLWDENSASPITTVTVSRDA